MEEVMWGGTILPKSPWIDEYWYKYLAFSWRERDGPNVHLTDRRAVRRVGIFIGPDDKHKVETRYSGFRHYETPENFPLRT
jgi:hypothetical protein